MASAVPENDLCGRGRSVVTPLAAAGRQKPKETPNDNARSRSPRPARQDVVALRAGSVLPDRVSCEVCVPFGPLRDDGPSVSGYHSSHLHFLYSVSAFPVQSDTYLVCVCVI